MRAHIVFLSSLCLLAAASRPAFAQGGEQDMEKLKQLVRQIHRNMKKVETNLARVEAEGATKAGQEAKKGIDELIDGLKGSSSQVVKDMDELIKNWPQGSGGGGGGGQKSQSQSNKPMPKDRSKSRDRNKPNGQKNQQQGGKKPQSGKDQGKQDGDGQKPEQGKKPGKQQKNGPENNTGANPKGGDNQDGQQKDPVGPVKVQHVNLVDRWGVLPPELKQKLVDRDFKEFTPEYEAKIRSYLKKIATPKKRR